MVMKSLFSLIHHRLRHRWLRVKRHYYRVLLEAPSLELHFPIVIEPLHGLRVGKNVALGAFVHILANERVTIGDNSIIAAHVQITTSTHDYRIMPFRSHRDNAQVVIGSNVWIGSGAVILPGVTIGDNSVVGAGSVVTRSIPPYSVVVGSPAKVIRQLVNPRGADAATRATA